MKQVLIDQRDGRVFVDDVPPPICDDDKILVRVHHSVISSGTERNKVKMGKKSLLAKARSRPDLVRKVVDGARREGLLATGNLVRERLSKPQPLGYSAAGVVHQVGYRVEGIRPGDLVACSGAGYANHAEFVAVPARLCARVPEGVSTASAAFATIGSIALHAIHQSALTPGERVAVAGLGLVGQLTIRILRCYGHQVIGIDPDAAARRQAEALQVDCFSPHDPALASVNVDAVLLTAATRSNDLIQAAPTWCRDRGRVVVVGDVGLELERSPFYELEIDLRFSRSYGPGRYDPTFEEEGNDYPIGYVRWTEQRNIVEILRLLNQDSLQVSDLISATYRVEEAAEAYAMLSSTERVLAILLDYNSAEDVRTTRTIPSLHRRQSRDQSRLPIVDFLGAGNFASRVLIPEFRRRDLRLRTVVSASGTSAKHVAKSLGFEAASSAPSEVAEDLGADITVIATRHSAHASLAMLAASAGKAVFLEKPLAVTHEQLEELCASDGASGIMVGFNRRFSQATIDAERALQNRNGPATLDIRVNAGQLPSDHWVLTDAEGGRLVGEACHFIDLACHLTRSPVTTVMAFGSRQNIAKANRFTVSLSHLDGSITNILYTTVGSSRIRKERIEVHWDDTSAIIDDFRKWRIVGPQGSTTRSNRRQDKGHATEVGAFLLFATGHGPNPVPLQQSAHVTELTLLACDALATGEPQKPKSIYWDDREVMNGPLSKT